MNIFAEIVADPVSSTGHYIANVVEENLIIEYNDEKVSFRNFDSAKVRDLLSRTGAIFFYKQR